MTRSKSHIVLQLEVLVAFSEDGESQVRVNGKSAEGWHPLVTRMANKIREVVCVEIAKDYGRECQTKGLMRN